MERPEREQIAFRMLLNDGQQEEYRRRHDALWPELRALLKEAGISNYSIFLDPESNHLFGVLDRTADHGMDTLPQHPVMRRWWDHMKDIMQSNPDGSPVVWPLSFMFHLD